jgi:hypothetical protein
MTKTYKITDRDTRCEIALVEANSAADAINKYAPGASREFVGGLEVSQVSHSIPESSSTAVIA